MYIGTKVMIVQGKDTNLNEWYIGRVGEYRGEDPHFPSMLAVDLGEGEDSFILPVKRDEIEEVK